jgi:CheY-like chemotaxis protein
VQPSPRPIEILMIEDNAADVFLMSTALRNTEVANNVTSVSDGERALAFLKREGEYSGASRPDVVLLDLGVPRIDGHEVLAAMKGDAGLRSIPVVVISGSRSDSDLARAYENHVAAYIVKPSSRDEFFNAIHALKKFLVHMVVRPSDPAAKDDWGDELASESQAGE